MSLALDIEGSGPSPRRRFQVGVSMLDTRALHEITLRRPPADMQLENLLQTRNFCVGTSEYCSNGTRRFLFGQSETVEADQIKPEIEGMVTGRDFVLVVHDGHHDLRLWRELQVDVQPVAILDTQKAATVLPELPHSCSLKNLMVALECPFNFPHTAGNDANFTLRALLMIALRDSQDKDSNELQQTVLSALQAIAQSTQPHNWHENRDRIRERERALKAARTAERPDIKRQQREKKKAKKAVHKAKLAEEGHSSATKSGRDAF
jgi:hypothetical protein